MFHRRHIALGVALMLGIVGISSFAEETDPIDLLKEVGATYRNAKTFHFQLTITTEILDMGDQPVKIDTKMEIASGGGKKLRAVLNNPFTQLIAVGDGETEWVYIAQLGQYTKTPLDPEAEIPNTSPLAITTRFADVYRGMPDNVAEAKIIRQEPVKVGQTDVPATLVEVTFKPGSVPEDLDDGRPKSYWIEETRHLIVREAYEMQVAMQDGSQLNARSTTNYALQKINEPLPESLFLFEPPEDAQQVEKFGKAESKTEESEPDLTGQDASDFTLTSLSGDEVTLSGLRGKVVLLNFWASWCNPCRIEMPTIQKLHEEFGDKGLLVFGVNSEEPDVARAFIEEMKLTFPTLRDPGDRVSQSYQVFGIPTTFIIDKEGKIAAHLIGLQTEEQFRVALAKVGIE